MSDFKFTCENCGQHLAGDVRYAGLQITCPSCGRPVSVPTAPPAAGVTVAPAMPPIPGARPQPGPRPPQQTCGLAIASLVCSLGSFIIPFGFIAGIVCGHMAKKKIAATPGLQGAGLAKAGLIIGYILLGVVVLAVVAVAGFFMLFAARMQQAVSMPGQPRIVSSSRGNARPDQAEATDQQPDGSGWTMKLAGTETPSAPVTGRIHGQPFKMDKVTLENGWLDFRQGSDFFADLEMDVVVFESDLNKLSGKSFLVPKEEFGGNPHIWMKWKPSAGSTPQQRNFMDRYALRLEFGQLSGGKLPGKIYLCLPDQEKSFIAGTFEAEVKASQ